MSTTKHCPSTDQGPVDPAMRMGTITLLTVPTAISGKRYNQLITPHNQTPNRPITHKWITPPTICGPLRPEPE